MTWLTAYPIATISSAAFYLLLVGLAIPSTRAVIGPLFAHPIPPHQQFLQGFDAIRGFAAAFVAMSHCWWASYPVFASTQLVAPWLAFGTKGVSIFAALSGFLIYRSGLLAVQSIANLREYVVRRFFRIYPIYAFCVALCLVFGQYVSDTRGSATSRFFADLFLFATIYWPDSTANPPAWSLYVEVAFYAALPLVLVVAGQRRMLVLCVLGIAALILADHQSRLFALWKYFLIGIVASELSPRLSWRTALAAATAGLAILVVDFGGPSRDWAAQFGIGLRHLDEQTVGLGLGIGLLLASLPKLPLLARALDVLPLRLLGVISYSVYLIQFFYIRANFPEIALFSNAGSQELYRHFSQLPSYPAWYLPLVFFPGVLFWGCVCFLLVEKPGMRAGRYLLKRSESNRAPTPPE